MEIWRIGFKLQLGPVLIFDPVPSVTDLSIYFYRQDNIDNDELSFLGTHMLLYRKGRLLILGKFTTDHVTASSKTHPARGVAYIAKIDSRIRIQQMKQKALVNNNRCLYNARDVIIIRYKL